MRTLAILSAINVKSLAVERKVKQKFLKINLQIAFWKTELSNATYGLNTSLANKQPKWYFKENVTLDMQQRSLKKF